VFTARYALSPYIKQIGFLFKGLKQYVVEIDKRNNSSARNTWCLMISTIPAPRVTFRFACARCDTIIELKSLLLLNVFVPSDFSYVLARVRNKYKHTKQLQIYD
jgi:hypothetical protein